MSEQLVEPQPAAAAARSGGKGRGFVAWALVVIAAILMPLALIAFWGQRTLTNTATYVDTVAPLVEEEVVKSAIVERTTDTLMTAIQENDVVTEAVSSLPPIAAEKLVPAISAAIEGLVTQVATSIVNSDQFEEFWVVANTKLQEALIRVLSGDTKDGPIQASGDQVVLDTAPIAEAVQQELVSRGLTVLEGKPLPPAADQEIVLLEAPQLRQAQLIYDFTIPLTRYLLPVLAVLVLVAVAISTRRARIVMGIGIGLTVGMGLLSVGLGVAETLLANAAPTSQVQALLNVFWNTLTRYLTTAVGAWLAAGIVIALVGWFGGRSRPASSVRGAVSGGLTRSGGRLAGGPLAGLSAFLESHWRAVFIVLGVLATGSVLLFGPASASLVLWVAAIALGLSAIVTWLRGGATASNQATG